MAGLLDFLNSDDARLGFNLLAAGGPSTVPMSFGQRLAGAVDQFQQGRDAAEDRKMKRSLFQSQIDENKSQNEVRAATIAKAARQAEWERYFLGMPDASGAPPSAPSTGAGAGGSVPSLGGSPPSAGAPGGGGAAPADAPFGGMTAAQIAQRYSLPIEQVISDYKFNNGKKIAEFINDRTKPNWQQVGGNWVNTNAPGFTGGIHDQVIASPNGSVGVLRGGPQPSFSLVPGSIGAVENLEDTRNASQARFSPGKGTIGASGRPEPTSVAEDLGVGSARGTPPVLPGRPLGAPARQINSPGLAGGNSTAAASGQVETLVSEIPKTQQALAAARASGDVAGAQRAAQDLLGIQRELQRLPGGAQALAGLQAPARAPVPMIGPGAGRGVVNPAPADGTGVGIPGGTDFSPTEKAAQDAQRARLVKTAEADVGRDSAKLNDVKTAKRFLSIAEQAGKVLADGPTASGAGSMVDSGMAFFGGSTKGAEAAQRLKALGGWLVANVPRMEGPQSNFDVANYQVMAADVANDSLPVARRRAALESITQMLSAVAEQGGGADGMPGAGKTVVKTGTLNGRKVVKYSDGSTAYAD